MKRTLTFVGLNIMFCVILLGDAFILPSNSKTVAINKFGSKYSTAELTNYYNYFIYTSDDCKYEVNKGVFDDLKASDTIMIHSSSLLHMPVKISYSKNDKTHVRKIGQLNSQDHGRIGLIISLIISIIVFISQYIRSSKISQALLGLQLISFSMLIVVLLFVFIEIFSI